MSGEHYPVLWIGRTAVMSLPVEIDITNADRVREDLLSVLNQGAVLLIADLSRTTFCDSAGVGAVARSFRRAKASGRYQATEAASHVGARMARNCSTWNQMV